MIALFAITKHLFDWVVACQYPMPPPKVGYLFFRTCMKNVTSRTGPLYLGPIDSGSCSSQLCGLDTKLLLNIRDKDVLGPPVDDGQSKMWMPDPIRAFHRGDRSGSSRLQALIPRTETSARRKRLVQMQKPHHRGGLRRSHPMASLS